MLMFILINNEYLKHWSINIQPIIVEIPYKTFHNTFRKVTLILIVSNFYNPLIKINIYTLSF